MQAALGVVVGVAAAQTVEVEDAETERVYYDGADDQGRLTGGVTRLAIPDLSALGPGPIANWTTILDNGPPANRIDFVFVGDGYLEAELGVYAGHVDIGLNVMISQEPFLTYGNYFNFHRVDVISNESGVDNDPVQGIFKDTALNMGFWCGGIERLLCVSVSLAYQYAGNAPEVDRSLRLPPYRAIRFPGGASRPE